MARLIQFLLLLLFVRSVWQALQKLLGGSQPPEVDSGRSGTPIHRGRMVKDPVCGLYIPLDRSLSIEARGKTVYFCSERCRDSYRAGSPAGDAVNGQAV